MKKLILILALLLGSAWIAPQTAEARPNKSYHYSQKKKVKKNKVKKVRVVKPARQTPPVIVRQQVNNVATNADDETSAAYFERENRRAESVEQTRQGVAKAFSHIQTPSYYGGDLINKASKYVGASASQLGLPSRLWCADFVNMIAGGTDRRAISYVQRGKPAYHGCVNCVAVTQRRGGHHVGIVTGYDSSGNPIIISGNHGRRVGIGVYARNRVIAYRYV